MYNGFLCYLDLMMKTVITFFLSILLIQSHAQKVYEYEWSPISPKDFYVANPEVVEDAEAVVLAEKGLTEIKDSYFDFGGRKVTTIITRRLLIIKKQALERAILKFENISAPGYNFIVSEIDGSTHSLENGVVTTKKLSKKDFFKEKKSAYVNEVKVLMPAVKEGSIIEYSYVIQTVFIGYIKPWFFQADVPVLWSDYELVVPPFFEFIRVNRGISRFHINTNLFPGDTVESKEVSISATEGPYRNRWVVCNILPFKKESFVASDKNYRMALEFQLLKIHSINGYPFEFISGWKDQSVSLKYNRFFGWPLEYQYEWAKKIADSIGYGISDTLILVKKLYGFVRDSFKVYEYKDDIYLSRSLTDIFIERAGTQKELNMLFVALLRNLKLKASMALGSSRHNGFLSRNYPFLEKVDIVLGAVEINEKRYLFDVSSRFLSFGELQPSAYNGMIRLINDDPVAIELPADSLTDKSRSVIELNINESGEVTGDLNKQFGFATAYEVRKLLSSRDTSNLKSDFVSTSTDFEIKNFKLKCLNMVDSVFLMSYTFISKAPELPVLYINPMATLGLEENPFKEAHRIHPVEMPFCIDRLIETDIIEAQQWKVDELPASFHLKDSILNAQFNYSVTRLGNRIKIISHIKIAKANFTPQDYPALRVFYKMILLKQSANIVFKKSNK